MALHQQELIDVPGLIDLEPAFDRLIEMGNLAAIRFLQTREGQVRLERTNFGRFTEMSSRFHN